MKKVIDQNIDKIEKEKKDGKYVKGQFEYIIPEEGFF